MKNKRSNDLDGKVHDVAIIGGGASGMACAILLAQLLEKQEKRNISIVLCEKNSRLGKKLRLTGNGRCNLTNKHLENKRFHGNLKDFSAHAIGLFNNDSTLRFFQSIGLDAFYDESGKAFPKSLHSSSVLDCMRFAVEESGVCVRTQTQIQSIQRSSELFLLLGANEDMIRSRRVVIACGGSASPFTGSNGDGFSLLEQLGHSIISPVPGIVQVRTETDFVSAAVGIRCNARISLWMNNEVKREEEGEILFTEYGLSGPPVLQLSGMISRTINRSSKKKQKPRVSISIDFMPMIMQEELVEVLKTRKKTFPNRSIDRFLVGLLHNRLAIKIMKESTRKPMNLLTSALCDDEIILIANTIKKKNLLVLGTMSLQNAQITIGGANSVEFDPQTMQSLFCPGLYACGEVLDVDGECGGFNLQWAWSSAYLAAFDLAASSAGADSV